YGRRCIFFFQAEDGIRDFHVTGVQTCALPIFEMKCRPADKVGLHGVTVFLSHPSSSQALQILGPRSSSFSTIKSSQVCLGVVHRSEERRVGKEGGSQRSPIEQ